MTLKKFQMRIDFEGRPIAKANVNEIDDLKPLFKQLRKKFK